MWYAGTVIITPHGQTTMASERVILSWNFTNWVTVVLMAVIGWAIYRYLYNFVTIYKERQVSE